VLSCFVNEIIISQANEPLNLEKPIIMRYCSFEFHRLLLELKSVVSPNMKMLSCFLSKSPSYRSDLN